MGKRDEQVQTISKRAHALGYSSLNFDYDPPRIGKKSTGYLITAKTDKGFFVLLAAAGSWQKCYKQAIEYLNSHEET